MVVWRMCSEARRERQAMAKARSQALLGRHGNLSDNSREASLHFEKVGKSAVTGVGLPYLMYGIPY